jgi:signal recognition particle subunit SRP54
MFSRLSDKLQEVLKDLRGHGRISEENVNEAMREIRMALLEADVHFSVARAFIARVKEKALGEGVLLSVTPGQQIVKIFHDELTALLGGDAAPMASARPLKILVVGLNGAGKTTSSAKLALWLKGRGHQPRLVACDLRRPAAIAQLVTLGEQTGVPVFQPEPGMTDAVACAASGSHWCSQNGGDVQIFDTAGRQEIDGPLIEELIAVKEAVHPHEILLVCDAATGQQAVSVAEHFHAALSLTGIILTKLDGDARGGAALSLREVSGQPIKFAGTGEKPAQFEPFVPDRMAGRILGMGDIVGLVEKAAEAVTEEDALRMEQKLRSASFDLQDFLSQFKMLRRMGPLENVLGMIPGMDKLPSSSIDENQLKRVEAIILSMTPNERARPDILNARRRRRVACGSGTSVTEVNNLLLRFNQTRKMMKKMGNLKKLLAGGGRGGIPGMNLPGLRR